MEEQTKNLELPTKKSEISDVIGTSGVYQKVCMLLAFYQYALTGCFASLVQFLAPPVDLYWSSANGSHMNPFLVVSSTDCQLKKLMKMKPNITGHNSSLIYESKYSRRTLTEELGLICEDSWLTSLASSAISVGVILSGSAFALLSGRIGRKWFIQPMIVPALAANLCLLFIPCSSVFIITFFVFGCLNASSQASFVTFMELVPVASRPHYVYFSAFALAIGQCVAGGFAWIFKDWFYTQIACTVFITGSYTFSWFMMESPSWLIVRGRSEEAEAVLKTILKRNSRDILKAEPKITLYLETMKKRSDVLQEAEGRFQDLFKGPTMWKFTLSLSWVMFSAYLVSYALNVSLETFGTSLFEDIFIASLSTILLSFICTVLLSKISLRKCKAAFFLLVTIGSCLYAFLRDYDVARTVLVSIIDCLANILISTTNAYSTEVFPTSVRSLGYGFLRITGRIGGTIGPFSEVLGDVTTTYLPLLVLGAVSFPNVLLLLFVLPETKGKQLHQTVEELEKSVRKKSPEQSSRQLEVRSRF